MIQEAKTLLCIDFMKILEQVHMKHEHLSRILDSDTTYTPTRY
jgi:hypothetical protein